MPLPIRPVAALIEFFAALVIFGALIMALITLFKSRSPQKAQVLFADGVLTALSFVVAAGLLKTIALQTWQTILMFVAILSLRTALKQVFLWERRKNLL